MKKYPQKIVQTLETFPRNFIIGLSLFLVIIITSVDYSIKIDLGISIFYLLPIIIVTWYGNRQFGLIFSLICSLGWLWAETKISENPQLLLEQWNAAVRFCFFIIVTYLLSELREAYERERKFARTDSLTGAMNRRFFLEVLQGEIERLTRYNHPFTLAYFDVDNFKMVNDKLGHSQGDYLLMVITETITVNIRQTDILARLGGDEFALILIEIDYEKANIVLNRIQEQLLKMANIEKMPISFSIGAITYYVSPDSVDRAIEEVDYLMYDIKNSGKNGLKHKIQDPINVTE